MLSQGFKHEPSSPQTQTCSPQPHFIHTGMDEIKGFSVVPVTLPAGRHHKEATHYMYMKKHQSSTMKQMAERSIFVVNPPLAASLHSMRKFFQSLSTNTIIENLFINEENLDYEINLTKLTSDLYDDVVATDDENVKLPNGTALVVFVDKSACSLAMSKLKKYAKSKDHFVWNIEDSGDIASIRMAKLYKQAVLPLEETSVAVTLALQEFESRETKSIEELDEMKTVVDEDGFTMVVGKNRKTKRGILGKISGTAKVKEIEEKKGKKKEKADFYRFQIREKKKLEMNELLKKFRDDQERIKELKEKKRFRPY